MNPPVFDAWTTALSADLGTRRSRRHVLGGLVGGIFGLLSLTAMSAKHRKKHHKKKRGSVSPPVSPPASPPPPSPPAATCMDGIKNGAESDVDCGGGTCPRCQGGQICTSREDCHTALCPDGTCGSCVNGDDCGLDSNGNGCFCRDNAERAGERMCTRQTCTLFVGGTCADCAVGEQCAPAGGDDIECCTPCGGPL